MTRLTEITDRATWNRIVVGMPHSDLRQAFEWAEVKKADGWRPRRFALFEGEQCLAAASVLVKPVPLPLARRNVLYAPGGPLFANTDDDTICEKFMAGISEVADEEHAVFLRVDPQVPDGDRGMRRALENSEFTHLSDDWTTWNVPRIVMMMDLHDVEAAIKKKIRRRFRDYIASAEARGLTIRPASSEEEGREFHSALAAAGRRKGLPVRGRRYFERLWQEYLRDDKGVLLIAEHNGNVVGGLLGTRLGKNAYMLYVTQRDRPDGDPLHQGPVLYWEFVRWAKRMGCEQIDWGGVGTHYPPREDDPGFGVYRFKRGFDSHLQYLTGYYDRIFAPRAYRLLRHIERSYSAVAWTTRANLNEALLGVEDVAGAGRRKLRQFAFSVSHRGLLTTLYWAAFGFLKPNRFFVLSRNLGQPIEPYSPGGIQVELWNSERLRAWRKDRAGLTTEFFQNEIDGVERCVVARLGEEVAGLIWIYYPGDKSRLFDLRDNEAELNQGYVFPAYRKRGVFKAVLDHASAALRKQGYLKAYAMVHFANVPSLRAFEDVGFARQGKVRHFLAWRPKFRTPRAEVTT